MEQLPPTAATGLSERTSLNGEVAVVTGGASGIGRVTGFVLASAGADVVLVDVDADGLADTADDVEDTFDVRVETLRTDVTDEAAIRDDIAAVAASFGGIDVVANVAGGSRFTRTADLDADAWGRLIDVNLTSVFLVSKACYPHLDDGGRIVNTASVAGIYGSAVMSPYASAKAGIMALTRSLANEWASDNIRVNAVAPSPVYTAGIQDWVDTSAEEAHDRADISRQVGSPIEVADTILFLASDLSSFISGETLVVGGVPPNQETIWS